MEKTVDHSDMREENGEDKVQCETGAYQLRLRLELWGWLDTVKQEKEQVHPKDRGSLCKDPV